MQTNRILLPLDIYYEHLITINGVEFTPREIDVISCILNRRATSISSFLLVGQRAIETYIRNIRQKAGLGGREQIIDFIERSGKFSLLKNEYYLSLRFRVLFEEKLNAISKTVDIKPASCLLVYEKEQKGKASLISYLKEHLRRIGFDVKTHCNEGGVFFTCLNEKVNFEKADHILYVASKNLGDLENSQINLSQLSNIIFLIPQEVPPKDIYRKLNYINVFEEENYYFSFFEILKKLLPQTKFDSMIEEFKQQYDCINESFDRNPQENPTPPKGVPPLPIKRRFLTTETACFLIGLIAAVSTLSLWFFWGNPPPTPKSRELSIHSDFILPSESTLLNRPELMSQIDDKFKRQGKGIQTVALVGIGGAGKTTLVRHYASQQKATVVWEINAETQETLLTSFETLALSLAQTEEEKKEIKGIQEIKNSTEKADKLIQWVQNHLLAKSWLLIYDNVQNFADIRNYFPQNLEVWGRGKLLLTTRNSNISNNSHILGTIEVRELTQDQKLSLFTKIIGQGILASLTTQEDTVKDFLEKIPPFPLDVSLAAYYLKATQTPYKEYLDRLKEYDKTFESTQINLLQEETGYTKTRHAIISLSINNIINNNQEFIPLLFFVTLIDSQNIPRNLLKKIKSSAIVDNFIISLKKHSLITNVSSSVDTTLSLHRSTQEIMRSYFTVNLDLRNKRKLVSMVTDVLENHINEAIKNTNLKQMKEIVKHCEFLLTHRDLITEEMEGTIQGGLGIINYFYGDNIKAKKLLKKGVFKLNKHSQKNFMRIAFFMGYLGNTFRDLGDYRKGKQFLEQSITYYEKNYPKDAYWYARFLSCLGVIERFFGNYQAAKKLFEQSITVYNSQLSECKINVAWVSGQLGLLDEKIGYYEKAKITLEKSLAAIRKKWGKPEDHFDVAWGLEHLGSIYINLGDFEKGKNALGAALKIYSSYFPDEIGGPWIEAHLNNNITQSKKLFKRISEIYSSHFHENYIYVAWSLNQLATLYTKLKNYEKAKLLLEQCLFIYQKNYGAQHLTSADIFTDLGALYLLEGDFEAAKNFAEKALMIYQQEKHSDSYLSLEVLSDLSTKKFLVAKHKGEFQQAESLKYQAIDYLEQALKALKTQFPSNSPHVIRIQDKLKKLGSFN